METNDTRDRNLFADEDENPSKYTWELVSCDGGREIKGKRLRNVVIGHSDEKMIL